MASMQGKDICINSCPRAIKNQCWARNYSLSFQLLDIVINNYSIARYQGLTMNTFGKGGGETGGYTRSGDFLIIGIDVSLLFPVSMLNVHLSLYK